MKIEIVDGNMDDIILALAGPAQHECYSLLSRCAAENNGKLSAAWISKAKTQMIMERFQGALSFESPDAPDVGGNEALMEYAEIAKANFGSEQARKRGIPNSKGIILVGYPGCGKSLTPKALARKWKIPLIRVNFGELFSKYVGESERNAKAIQQVLEALSPCIAWIDEIEKAFAGTGGSGDGDSGTSLRVFGSFLSWLQDKQSPVFMVATANNIAGLRDELKRKGRFDEIFFVDIPTEKEREAIADIHIKRLGEYMKGVDAKAIAKATEGFSGAEIEAALIEAMRLANYRNQSVTKTEDVLQAISHTTPMTKSSPELLPSLRNWANKCNVRKASKQEEPSKAAETFSQRVVSRGMPGTGGEDK